MVLKIPLINSTSFLPFENLKGANRSSSYNVEVNQKRQDFNMQVSLGKLELLLYDKISLITVHILHNLLPVRSSKRSGASC